MVLIERGPYLPKVFSANVSYFAFVIGKEYVIENAYCIMTKYSFFKSIYLVSHYHADTN